MHIIEERPRNSKLRNIALMVAIGLSIHDFPEGFAISSSFLQQSALGMLVLISVAIHDIPERFATAVPLVLSRKKSFVYKMAFMTAFAEPVGAVIGVAAISLVPGLTPLFLAFAAGAMIFICLDELVPLALGYKRLHYFIAGVGASLLVYFAISSVL
jgi:ZIP family zinc transporter